MKSIKQRTLVVLKPDALDRKLAGEIIARLERATLKLVEAKMVSVDKDLAAAHYPVTEEWLEGVGGKSLGDYEKYGLDAKESLGTDVPKEIGHMVHKFNIEYIMSTPVLAMVWEGSHAIEIVRKLTGSTLPILAEPGSIRGDFSADSALLANSEGRSIYNLVHASSSEEEAEREIELWFGKLS